MQGRKSRLLAVGAQAASILTLAEIQIGLPTPTTYVFAPELSLPEDRTSSL